jgi:hypothetical protein
MTQDPRIAQDSLVGVGRYGRYRDWLGVGRTKSQSSSPGRVNNFLFPMLSRRSILALESIQPPFQSVPGPFVRG